MRFCRQCSGTRGFSLLMLTATMVNASSSEFEQWKLFRECEGRREEI